MKTFVPERRSQAPRVAIVLAALAALGLLCMAFMNVRVDLPAPTVVTVTPAKTSTAPAAPAQAVAAEKADAPEKAENPPPLDLIGRVDLEAGTVAGKWEVKNGELFSDATQGARLQFPLEAPDEYDVECEFTRLSGKSTMNLLLARRDKKFGFCLGWQGGNGCHFFEIRRSGKNPTYRPLVIQNGRRYAVKVEVRATGIKAYVDGAPMGEWKTNFQDMGRWNGWDLKKNSHIGVGTWESPTAIHALKLTEIKATEAKNRQQEF